jgi:hypothetical protein
VPFDGTAVRTIDDPLIIVAEEGTIVAATSGLIASATAPVVAFWGTELSATFAQMWGAEEVAVVLKTSLVPANSDWGFDPDKEVTRLPSDEQEFVEPPYREIV